VLNAAALGLIALEQNWMPCSLIRRCHEQPSDSARNTTQSKPINTFGDETRLKRSNLITNKGIKPTPMYLKMTKH